MAPSTVHLPNGGTLTVTPVFGGLYFKANDLTNNHTSFPPGWTIILNCEDDDDEEDSKAGPNTDPDPTPKQDAPIHHKPHHTYRFRKPSLHNDHLYISSISNPPSNEFRPASSPTRQIALMLWATLWWYFHQPEPSPYLARPGLDQIPEQGRPKGEWRININREGIFKSKHLLPKLERMGLITTEDSSVGLDPDDGVSRTGEGWTRMFVSRRVFWQLDARIYLFTLAPLHSNSPYPTASPVTSRPSSRPGSPNRNSVISLGSGRPDEAGPSPIRGGWPQGPFFSSSHLPTFYPPPPVQYTFTNNVRHPIRPKPPRQGETFYVRYIPSLEQHLSFRVASLSKRPNTPHWSTPNFSSDGAPPSARDLRMSVGNALTSGLGGSPHGNSRQHSADYGFNPAFEVPEVSDCELLHKWMNDPRVSHSWGEQGPLAHQEDFLRRALSSRHSFPVIGCFDGRPFGYFEIYWVREDQLAARMGNEDGSCGDWDRGLHALVGEQEFRGPHRVRVWLSALVHYCWLADQRTNVILLEPRVDNLK